MEEEQEGGDEGDGEKGEGEEAKGGNEEADEHDQLKQLEESQEEEEGSSAKPKSPHAEFVSSDVCYVTSRHKHGTLAPYGLPCIRELLRFLVSIINMRER